MKQKKNKIWKYSPGTQIGQAADYCQGKAKNEGENDGPPWQPQVPAEFATRMTGDSLPFEKPRKGEGERRKEATHAFLLSRAGDAQREGQGHGRQKVTSKEEKVRKKNMVVSGFDLGKIRGEDLKDINFTLHGNGS